MGLKWRVDYIWWHGMSLFYPADAETLSWDSSCRALTKRVGALRAGRGRGDVSCGIASPSFGQTLSPVKTFRFRRHFNPSKVQQHGIQFLPTDTRKGATTLITALLHVLYP